MYANVAVDAPVDKTFDYHIPPELEGELVPGHLVQVAFGTAMQHAIVLALHDETPPYNTKPIQLRLDPRPVVTEAQIEISRWLADTYLAPIGPCLWLWLPPGLTGHRDISVQLLNADGAETELEHEIVALLEKRGQLRGHQLNLSLPGKDWRGAVDALARSGVVKRESMLTPPRVKPKIVQTASLAIHPDQIMQSVKHLERTSRAADLLEVIADAPDGIPSQEALKQSGAAKTHLEKLVSGGLVTLADDQIVTLTIPLEDVLTKLAEMRKTEMPTRILKVLGRAADVLDVSWIFAQTGASMPDLKRLEEAELIILGEAQKWRDSMAAREFVALEPPPLTPEQNAVWEPLREAIIRCVAFNPNRKNVPSGNNTFLLHGVTGSGKTEIYLRAIELTLSLGRNAIFLVPEIALTAQTLRRVAARFPGKVAVVHSGLSEGERYDTWRRAREGLVQIVVGARSALFTPLPDIGMIVLDEEHDPSYKHSPPTLPPYYHTRQVAERMMGGDNGIVILGSATPSVETFYRSEQEDITRLALPSRIMGHRVRIQEQAERQGVLPSYRPDEASDALMIDLPLVRVIDMREELKSGNVSIFSRALQTSLAQVLERGEQAILFLNRRGQNTYVFCRDCGYVVKCPRCDMPLTYHRHGQALRCHRCDYMGAEPSVCPECHSRRIKFFGAGTQQVEQTLVEMFPRARVVRWDADTADSPEAHDTILQRFVERKADVMVGTQMVAKGLDLPLVTLVGVVSADVGLGMPDFRAGERTFQVLTQVAGRAGRGLLGGNVILQTYQPEHYTIMAAAKHDYAQFYQREINYRRDIGYPPYRRIVRILFRFPNEMKAKSEAERAAVMLRRRIEELEMTGTELIGPAPCFFTRENQIFRWHLLLRGPDPIQALRGMDVPKGWHVDVDPVEVL